VVKTNGSLINDANKENVSIEFANVSLFEQLMKINSMVGIDMKKHLQNLQSGKSFDLKDSLKDFEDNFAGIGQGPLAGIDVFMLDYSVSFPLSLVLNKKVLTKYQLIFRHLFKCKYLKRLLGMVWLEETKVKKSDDKDLNGLILMLWSLRLKMFNFVQQIVYFMFFEVIDPHWRIMDDKIKKVYNN
jgi:gamma-tubulin complex component 2